MELGVRLHQRVDGLVPHFVDGLDFGMRPEIRHGLAHALRKARRADKVRHRALDLAVVHQRAGGLIAEQVALLVGHKADDLVGRDVHQLGLHAHGRADLDGDFVPGQRFVRGDVIRFADGLPAAHDADKALCKVGIVRHAPKARAVAVDDDGLAVEHSLHQRPRVLPASHGEGNLCIAVGQRRAHNGHGEVLRAIGVQGDLFAGALVPSVLPVAVVQRRGLRDVRPAQRTLIDRAG